MMTPEQLYDIFGFYDKDRFVYLRSRHYVYRCHHPRPISFVVDPPTLSYTNITNEIQDVRLDAVHKGRSYIGAVGKCEKCGKVYYHD